VLWLITDRDDPDTRALVDGEIFTTGHVLDGEHYTMVGGLKVRRRPHYSRQTEGARLWTRNGENLVFMTADCLSVWCTHRPSPARWGLAHDWTEGLGLVDLARPLKRLPEFMAYREIEAAMLVPVAQRFGLEGTVEPSLVKEVDQALCYTEARDLFPSVHPEWKWHAEPLPWRIVPLEHREALALFRARFEELWAEETWR
jgi:hypothetical protein